jgi:hypothetical protein
MKTITSLLAILALSSTFALAADDATTTPATTTTTTTTTNPAPAKAKGDPEAMFKKLNTTGDGKLTLEQWLAGKRAQKDPEKAKEFFSKRDKGNKGYLTLEEFVGHGGKKAAATSTTTTTPAAPDAAK